MTNHTNTRDTLLEREANEAQATPEKRIRSREGRRSFRPLVVIVAVAAVGVWAANQPQVELGDAPQPMLFDHDSRPAPWRARAAFLGSRAQHDARIGAVERERQETVQPVRGSAAALTSGRPEDPGSTVPLRKRGDLGQRESARGPRHAVGPQRLAV